MLKKLMNMKKKKGFTLIELIVVLVIMAILAAAAIPTMMGYVDEARASQYLAEGRSIYVSAQAGATEAYGKMADYAGDSSFTAATQDITVTIGTSTENKDPQTPADYITNAIVKVSAKGLPNGAVGIVTVDKDGSVTKVLYYTKGKAADGYKVTLTFDPATGENNAKSEKYEANADT